MEKDAGYIIAISTVKIPFQNHPRDIINDLGCLLALSNRAYQINQNTLEASGPYLLPEDEFKKTSTGAAINKDFFRNNTHVSAVLVSYCEEVFFPASDQYNSCINWKDVKNDFHLIHNPFANVELPSEILSVYKEYFNE